MLTAFAIVLGVAMISGAFVLTDTLGKSFDGISQESYESTGRRQLEGGDRDERRLLGGAGLFDDVLRKVQSPARRTPRAGLDRRQVQARRQARARRSGKAGSGEAVAVDPPPTSPSTRFNSCRATGRAARRSDRDRHGNGREGSTSRSARPSAPSATARSRSTDQRNRPLRVAETSLGGATISVYDLATAERLFDKRGKLDS